MITVVTGAPAAGKTTWIQSAMEDGDLVLDQDALPAALQARPTDTVNDLTYAMWLAGIGHILAEAKAGVLEHNVFIEHGNPTTHQRTRYINAGCKIVDINPGKSVNMQQLVASGTGTPERVADLDAYYRIHTPKRRGRAKGRGTEHDKQRAKLMRLHVDGTPCWWCGKPMYRDKTMNPDGMTLAADHTLAVAHGGRLADRLLHFTCNSARQSGERDHVRPAVMAVTDDDGETTPVFAWGS